MALLFNVTYYKPNGCKCAGGDTDVTSDVAVSVCAKHGEYAYLENTNWDHKCHRINPAGETISEFPWEIAERERAARDAERAAQQGAAERAELRKSLTGSSRPTRTYTPAVAASWWLEANPNVRTHVVIYLDAPNASGKWELVTPAPIVLRPAEVIDIAEHGADWLPDKGMPLFALIAAKLRECGFKPVED